MKTKLLRKAATKPLTLNSTDIAIISMIAKFPFASAIDVTHYLFSPGSITHVRRLLARLSGGDEQHSAFLYRFCLPSAASGNRERIFCLGAKGRVFIDRELGQSVNWWYRPYKQKFMSFSNVLHHLILTRTVVASYSWCRRNKGFRITQSLLCHELGKEPAFVDVTKTGKTERLKVIPDAWILFERLNNGVHERFMPCWIELDRGTEMGRRFREHIRSRIAYIQSGAYRERFLTHAVVIAYLTTGQTPEYRETRRKAMCRWTMEVLVDLHLENWSHIFHFASVECDRLYSTPLFDAPIWYRPDSPSPVRLFQ